MSQFHLDLATMVFLLAAINSVAAIFGLAHVGLTRSGLRLDRFILAKSCQGLSWMLRILWLGGGGQLFSSSSDLLLLVGLTFEFSMLAYFAQPDRRRHRFIFGGLFLLLAISGGVVCRFAPSLGGQLVFCLITAMILYSTATLFFAGGASPFQRFIAVFYVVVQFGIVTLYGALGDEVSKPGLAVGWGAIVYYAALIAMQLVGAIGYLLMVGERDKAALREQATRDALTGSLNRRAFFEMAGALIANTGRARQQVAVIIADLDHFKRINDTWGHDAGDRLLRAFAATVGRAVRQGDICARFGGDEFALLLPNCDQACAEEVAGRILADLRGLRLQVDGAELGCTASLGISTGLPDSLEALSRLLASADEALYAAKERGRDQAEARPLMTCPLT